MSGEDWRVLGDVDAGDAVGVLGRNTAQSGDAIGVKGESNAPDGYGLYSDANAHVAGTVEAGAVSVDGSQLYIQDTEPTNAAEGDVWIDTS